MSRRDGDALSHFKVATSPAMIALFSGMDEFGEQYPRAIRAPAGLLETSIGVVQDVTRVVLRRCR